MAIKSSACRQMPQDKYSPNHKQKTSFQVTQQAFCLLGFQHLAARPVCIPFSHGNSSLCPAVCYLNENRAEQPGGGAEQEHRGVSQPEAQRAEGSRDTDSAAVSGYSVSAGNFKTKLS